MVYWIDSRGANVHLGTASDDVLDGSYGNDYLRGAGGNDSLLGGTGADRLFGDAGADTLRGGDEADYLEGGDGPGADHLLGDGGDDVVRARRGDVADGGVGFDLLALDLADAAAMNVDLSGWAIGGAFVLAGSVLTGFEQGFVSFGGGDDKVRAAGFGLVLYGGEGADTLLGGAWFDELHGDGVGQTGADVIKGGDSDDVLYGDVGDVLDGGAAVDHFVLDLESSTLDYAVDFAPLAAGRNVFFGDGSRVGRVETGELFLGSGDDVVKTDSRVIAFGGGGADTLIGGEGSDTLSGGSGADVIRGGDGLASDTASYQLEIAGIAVDLRLTAFQDTGAGLDRLLGVENVIGGGGDDRIVGNAEANLLNGGTGADTLFGGYGADTLSGGSGSPDVDRLVGGPGQDLYLGGAGGDTLVWSAVDHTPSSAPDSIALNEDDVIDVSGIDADIETPGDQAFVLTSGLSGQAAQMWIWQDFSLNRTLWEMDVDGDGVADATIVAQGEHILHDAYVL